MLAVLIVKKKSFGNAKKKLAIREIDVLLILMNGRIHLLGSTPAVNRTTTTKGNAMTIEQIIAALASKSKGQVFTVKTVKNADKKKAFEHEDIIQSSTFQLQATSYASRKPVKDAIEAGERKAPKDERYQLVQKLECGVKIVRNVNSGKLHLSAPAFGSQSKKQLFHNGQPVEREEIAFMLKAPRKARQIPAGQVAHMQPLLENIVEVI